MVKVNLAKRKPSLRGASATKQSISGRLCFGAIEGSSRRCRTRGSRRKVPD